VCDGSCRPIGSYRKPLLALLTERQVSLLINSLGGRVLSIVNKVVLQPVAAGLEEQLRVSVLIVGHRTVIVYVIEGAPDLCDIQARTHLAEVDSDECIRIAASIVQDGVQRVVVLGQELVEV